MKRKIAAILAADVAGYSRLVADDEEETLTRLRDYQTVFKECIQQAGGRVFKTAGDSVLAEFPSAVDALRCAVNVQETLRVRNQAYPMSRQMAYRVGLTIGDVVDQDGDLLGDGVNIAARLESLAQPGGICISKAMHDAVSSKLSVKYIDMGSHQVKNIPIPVHVFSVSPDPRAASSSGGQPTAATADTHSSAPQRWRPPLAASALAVALVSAMVAYAIPRLFEDTPKQVGGTQEAAKPAATPSPASATIAKTGPDNPVPAGSTVQPPAAPPAPLTPAAGAPPVPSAPTAQPTTEDTASALRLRPVRWTACNEDDTDAAIRACMALASDTSVTGSDLALAQRRLGYALRKKGDLDAALIALNDSIKSAPSAAAHNDRGITFSLKGQYAEALTDYDEAVRLDAKNGDAWNNRAWTYFKTNRHKEALADADKAVTMNGDKAHVWDTRGHIHEALGERKAAEADFVKALSLEPDLATSRAGLKRLTGR